MKLSTGLAISALSLGCNLEATNEVKTPHRAIISEQKDTRKNLEKFIEQPNQELRACSQEEEDLCRQGYCSHDVCKSRKQNPEPPIKDDGKDLCDHGYCSH